MSQEKLNELTILFIDTKTKLVCKPRANAQRTKKSLIGPRDILVLGAIALGPIVKIVKYYPY